MLPTINMSHDRRRWTLHYPDAADAVYSLQIDLEYSHASDFRLEPDVLLWKDGVQTRVYMDADEFDAASDMMEANEEDPERREAWLDTNVPVDHVSGHIVTEVAGRRMGIVDAVVDAMVRWAALELILDPHVTF